MDALSDGRGQALVLTAILLGVAAAAIVGLSGVSHRILDGVRAQRAGEAAAAAAGTAVADLQFDRVRALGRELGRAEIAVFVADPAVAGAARHAAARLARLHDRADPTDVRVIAIGFEIEVHVTLSGRTHVALLGSNP
ncbi:MAG: hypothetical protein HYU87_02865 [Chloroflexi bacterium]|nr:hypothetical protein [Chloroflexota bacterium]